MAAPKTICPRCENFPVQAGSDYCYICNRDRERAEKKRNDPEWITEQIGWFCEEGD